MYGKAAAIYDEQHDFGTAQRTTAVRNALTNAITLLLLHAISLESKLREFMTFYYLG